MIIVHPRTEEVWALYLATTGEMHRWLGRKSFDSVRVPFHQMTCGRRAGSPEVSSCVPSTTAPSLGGTPFNQADGWPLVRQECPVVFRPRLPHLWAVLHATRPTGARWSVRSVRSCPLVRQECPVVSAGPSGVSGGLPSTAPRGTPAAEMSRRARHCHSRERRRRSLGTPRILPSGRCRTEGAFPDSPPGSREHSGGQQCIPERRRARSRTPK